MSYVSIRGNLGYSNTLVYGLKPHEKEQLAETLRRGPKTEDLNEVAFYNPPMTVMNSLESLFGYEVVCCTSTLSGVQNYDTTMWTMCQAECYPPNSERRSGGNNDYNSQGYRSRSYGSQSYEPRSNWQMPYLAVRGNLGCANTKVYGLSEEEQAKISESLRFFRRDNDKDEVLFHNAAMHVINQIEFFLGFVVVHCARNSDQMVWTMRKT